MFTHILFYQNKIQRGKATCQGHKVEGGRVGTDHVSAAPSTPTGHGKPTTVDALALVHHGKEGLPWAAS